MNEIIAALAAFHNELNALVWGPWFMALLAGAGIYLTIRLRFLQFTHLAFAWRHSFGRAFGQVIHREPGAITSFQAASAAMAGTIGVGNIAGVATALAAGGPGALFWMWVIGLIGMATKFAEASLGLKFRHVDADGRVSGGAFYYIERGLGWKWLAVIYALLAGFASFGIGNMVQANTIAHALETGFAVPDWVTGAGALILVGAVTLGGIKRLGAVAELIVPFMALAYVVLAVTVLVLFWAEIPRVFYQIVYYAFEPYAPVGGAAGATMMLAMRYGIARGLFSNEAGLGSASIVHAQAQNTPGRQGLWGMWEVFIDTIVVATMTGLVIIATGALATQTTGAALASNAFTAAIPGFGGFLVLIALSLFAYTTLLTWGFYGEKSFEYVAGRKAVLPYRIVFLMFIPIGAVFELKPVWDVADTLNGMMAVPNLIALVALAGVVAKERATLLAEHGRGGPPAANVSSAQQGTGQSGPS